MAKWRGVRIEGGHSTGSSLLATSHWGIAVYDMPIVRVIDLLPRLLDKGQVQAAGQLCGCFSFSRSEPAHIPCANNHNTPPEPPTGREAVKGLSVVDHWAGGFAQSWERAVLGLVGDLGRLKRWWANDCCS